MKNLRSLLSKAKNLDPVAFTKVWNFYGISTLEHVAQNKASNLYSEIQKIKASGYKGMLTLYVDQIGRSRHAASSVAILKGVTNGEEIGYSEYHAKRIGEIKIA